MTATRPTIGPTQAPEIETWPRIASITTQVTSPIAAAAFVFTKAKDAIPLNSKTERNSCAFTQTKFYFAELAEPPLNPNHPTQSKHVPKIVNGKLCATVLLGS